MTRILVVNADDFGRSCGVSAGIVEAHLHGLVSTTTALMNLPGSSPDVAQAARQVPSLGLGVHLNLTLGKPLSPPASVRSLVSAGGTFWPPDALAARAAAVKPDHVRREWRAQVEAFLSSGAALDHLDSHHHAAVFAPDWWTIALDLAAEFGCGVRPPAPADVKDDILFSRFPAAARRFATCEAQGMISRRGIQTADRLVTRFYGPAADLPTLLSILEALPDGTTELMCHPGRVDEALASESGYAREREAELAVLTSAQARSALQRAGIRLTTYRSMAIAT